MLESSVPWWHPDAFSRRLAFLRIRQTIVSATCTWFANQSFDEVETPALQISPGMEVHLHAFKTELRGPHPDDRQTMYLHTSPEFAMKKLLVAGMRRIFQMSRVWRNEERSATHHPEFTMLEWYRAHETYDTLRDDCVALIRACAQAAEKHLFKFRGIACDPFVPWEILTVPEAFQRYTAIDLMATIDNDHQPSPHALAAEAQRLGIRTAVTDTWEDIFFRIMFEKIEPHLGAEQPTFLTDYPISMAALARPKPENPHLAERFELYICGLELANAFGELTDPAEQRRRFAADMALKEKLYGERFPVDEDFLAALDHGMPPSSGIALGFDRLVMLCAGADRIEDVLWAPIAIPS